MCQPISMKLPTGVSLREIVKKQKWFCFLPFSSGVSGGGGGGAK